jgi:hypothetical protein
LHERGSALSVNPSSVSLRPQLTGDDDSDPNVD